MAQFEYKPGDIIRAGHGYKVLRPLGAGGMAGCYLGEHRKMLRRCAVKVLHSHLSHRTDLIEMFDEEGRMLAQLGDPEPHEGIIEILDLGRTEDRGRMPYLVMPYLQGETLQQALDREGTFPVLSAIGTVTRLCAALDYAHRRGVVHRDVKPHNVFLVQSALRGLVANEADRPHEIHIKLLDFGISKLIAAVDDPGVFIGTPSWMPPEQIAGDGVGPHSDIYSAGVVLFTLLTGQLPFPKSGKDRESLLKSRKTPAPRLAAFGDFHANLEELVARMLDADPLKRPRDAIEAAVELQRIREVILASTSDNPHATDRALYVPAGAPPALEPITEAKMAPATVEDTDIPRRARAAAEEHARRSAGDLPGGGGGLAERGALERGPITGLESTVEERARRANGASSPSTSPAPGTASVPLRASKGGTFTMPANATNLRRDAVTNLPAPPSDLGASSSSIEYATDIPKVSSYTPPQQITIPMGQPKRQAFTSPMPGRPRRANETPMSHAVASRSPSPEPRSPRSVLRWLRRTLMRAPTTYDVLAIGLAGAVAVTLAIGGMWLLGFSPKRADAGAPAPSPASDVAPASSRSPGVAEPVASPAPSAPPSAPAASVAETAAGPPASPGADEAPALSTPASSSSAIAARAEVPPPPAVTTARAAPRAVTGAAAASSSRTTTSRQAPDAGPKPSSPDFVVDFE